ncbi:hypothetical protein ABAC460_20765 [Asticcacaulis sp. AC460]|uniref:beta strand repeat-containing protein n=1 Tax=Asticcacaulis sp. AC460 TaxID=1282360 RepID=UPI0003C3D17A|nr:calcium-binding protein [Asticcacaulis sp. AC460]ESQ87206.1 hypothetical protein ABAC460_20765 [Asticcacaulis sp. AC460]
MAIFVGTPDHDTFIGTAGDDTFSGIAGGDKVDGGAGNDIISIDLSYTDIAVNYNAIAAATAAGTEPLWYMSVKNVERLGTLKTGGGDDSLTISAAQGAFVWNAGAGVDTLKLDFSAATAGMVTMTTADGYVTRAGSYANPVIGRAIDIERVQITGSAYGDDLRGTTGNDTLSGGAGDDTLSADGGKDAIDGGAGYDLLVNANYYDATVSVVYDAALATTEAGITLFNGTTIRNVESLSMTTGSGDDWLRVTTVQKNFTWIANGGKDHLIANYSYSDGAVTVTLIASTPLGPDLRIHTVEMGSADANAYMIESVYLTGSKFDDLLTGTAGADQLDGGILSQDTLAGGLGDDSYYVDHAGDVVTEAANEGTDTVFASLNYTLGANVERLVLTGTANLSGFGNTGDNHLTGNAGANVLDGRGGVDTLVGGAGDDSYYVDHDGDVVTEAANGGKDTVLSRLSYTLGANLENLVLIAPGPAAQSGYGNALNNLLTGTSYANVLDGKAGADTMQGHGGNDAYYVDDFGDVVIEAQAGGVDGVITGLAFYALGDWVENLTFTGTGANRGTGNDQNNALSGNSGKDELNGLAGDDRLDGKAGADIMNGGLGNDTFHVDNVGDVIGEYANEGTDLVYATVSFSLAGINAENLTLLGDGHINAGGNGFANLLTGNFGNNVLDGLAGNDTMAGGIGNDTYYVQSAGDKVVETAGQGRDLIFSSVSYSLYGQVVEDLTLTGSANLNATGNTLGNSLVGNSGKNILNGMSGKDVLTGGLGADVFLFTAGSGLDTITDFSAAQKDSIDVHAYTNGVANAGLVSQSGAHVLVALSSGNVVTVNNATVADVLGHIVW